MKKTLIALMAIAGMAVATEETPITLGVTFGNCAQATPANVTLSLGEVATGSVVSLVQTAAPTEAVTLQTKGTAGTAAAIFTPNSNVGTGTPWTATFSFKNVNNVLSSLDSIDLGVVLFNSGGEYQTNKATWTGDIVFTALITNSNSESLGTFTYTLTPTQGKGSATFDITLTGTSIDLTDVSSFNMELKLTETLGTGTFAGLKTMGFTGTQSIPEPTTATLSLLALAGLAARRRRK